MIDGVLGLENCLKLIELSSLTIDLSPLPSLIYHCQRRPVSFQDLRTRIVSLNSKVDLYQGLASRCRKILKLRTKVTFQHLFVRLIIMHLFCLWAYIAVALKKHRFRKNGSFAKSIIHDRPKILYLSKTLYFSLFQKTPS